MSETPVHLVRDDHLLRSWSAGGKATSVVDNVTCEECAEGAPTDPEARVAELEARLLAVTALRDEWLQALTNLGVQGVGVSVPLTGIVTRITRALDGEVGP